MEKKLKNIQQALQNTYDRHLQLISWWFLFVLIIFHNIVIKIFEINIPLHFLPSNIFSGMGDKLLTFGQISNTPK
jgi:hypothetical protein